MKLVSARDAVAAIPDGSTVVFPGGCVEPSAIYAAFAEEVERFRDLTIYSGLSFGEYPFLRRGLGSSFRYLTWQASPRLGDLFRRGAIGFVPMRYGEIHRLIRREGPIRPDVVVVQVSPPTPSGRLSLGIAVSVYTHLIEHAGLVIAEIQPGMPVTAGDSLVSADDLDLAVEAAAPLLRYRTPAAGERERTIVDRVLDLVPDGATVQLGVGAVPDLVLARLGEKRNVDLFSGLLTQGLIRFVEEARHTPTIVAGELAGEPSLYDFAGRTRAVRMAPTRVTHDLVRLAGMSRFTSINSALEVDLHGAVNGETIGDLQVSGVGGSLDYVEAAALSAGGISIIAFPSTTSDGKRSRIVSRLAPGAVVTTPRHCVDTVVTEYGVARLKGKDLRARAEALAAIAHPDFRDRLAGRGLHCR